MVSSCTVSVFGSARPAPGEPDYIVAYEVGVALAEAGFTVCNGGYAGIMEASARGAKDAGGTTIGVVTDEFSLRKPNLWIDTIISTETMIARMLELVRRGDAYVVLRGGTGTLLEFATVWELMNKNLLALKPIVVVGEFWHEVVRTMQEQLAGEGRHEAAKYVTVVGTPEECAERITRALTARRREPSLHASQHQQKH